MLPNQSLEILDSVQLQPKGNYMLYLRRVKVPGQDTFGWMPSVEHMGTVVENGTFYTDDQVATAIKAGNAMLEEHHKQGERRLRTSKLLTELWEGTQPTKRPESLSLLLLEAAERGVTLAELQAVAELAPLVALLREAIALEVSRDDLSVYLGCRLLDAAPSAA